MIKISPSMLSCDFAKVGEELRSMKESGADMVHLDVMDGNFVTNISFGLSVIESIRKDSDMIFDVHLMIDRPERYAERFIKAGADILTFHIEATEKSEEILKTIRSLGCKAAISVKPNTPAEAVFELLPLCDMVLVMTVEPGYGGQAFMPEMLGKISKLKAEIDRLGLSCDIQVDGGINTETAKQAIAAGANILVAGSAVFKAADRRAVIEKLRG